MLHGRRSISAILFLTAAPILAQDFDEIVRPPSVGARLLDPLQVRKRLGVSPEYDSVVGLASIKVAVLDYGFDGFHPDRKQLPPGVVVVEHYPDDFVKANHLGDPEFKKEFAPGNSHGRLMAQIVWGTTNFASGGPKFHLLNANGPTMFRRAVRFAVKEKVDVILFCNSFEGLGNFDGKGPINAVVDEAVRAGVIWINAAGNDGGRTYNGPVKIGADGFLEFSGGRNHLRFRNNLDENTLTVTLNWNDYAETEDAGTMKDLDLYVQDPNGAAIAKSAAVQIPAGSTTGENESKNPRERIVLPDLPADRSRDYLIRIKAMSRNFAPTDRIRVLLTAARDMPFLDPTSKIEMRPVEFLDATGTAEVLPPADHPRAIAVGDASASSSVGPTADSRVKPDFLIEDSQVVFSNGESSLGSSNAAAYFAGVVCILKATEPKLTTAHLLGLAKSRSGSGSAATRVGTSGAARSSTTQRKTTSQSSVWSPATIGRAKTAIAGAVVTALERHDPRLFVWLATDGRLTVAIERSPADLPTLFPRFPQERLRLADDFEFYLGVDRAKGTPKLVEYFRRKNANEPPPWQAVGGSAVDWVEVRRRPASDASVASRLQSLLASRLWKTPSKVDLRTAVGRTEAVVESAPRPAGK